VLNIFKGGGTEGDGADDACQRPITVGQQQIDEKEGKSVENDQAQKPQRCSADRGRPFAPGIWTFLRFNLNGGHEFPPSW